MNVFEPNEIIACSTTAARPPSRLPMFRDEFDEDEDEDEEDEIELSASAKDFGEAGRSPR